MNRILTVIAVMALGTGAARSGAGWKVAAARGVVDLSRNKQGVWVGRRDIILGRNIPHSRYCGRIPAVGRLAGNQARFDVPEGKTAVPGMPGPNSPTVPVATRARTLTTFAMGRVSIIGVSDLAAHDLEAAGERNGFHQPGGFRPFVLDRLDAIEKRLGDQGEALG